MSENEVDRHYRAIVYLGLLLAFCSAGGSVVAAEQEAQGNIETAEATLARTKIRNPLSFDMPARRITVFVKGKVSKGHLWLGCTVTWQGKELDLSAKRIRSERSGKQKAFAVRFSTLLAGIERIDGRAKEIPLGKVARWSVSLWRSKVSKRKCKKGDKNGPCQHCKKNGYHLAGRVDSRPGIASLPMKAL